MHPATVHGTEVITKLLFRSEVIQGHQLWYQSKARIHIPISGQQQLGPYLAPFQLRLRRHIYSGWMHYIC